MLLALGEAQFWGGESEASRQTFRQAGDLARALHDAGRLGRAAFGFSLGLVPGVDPERRGLLEEALAALGDADNGLRSRLLSSLAAVLALAPDQERRTAAAQEALQLARRAGDIEALVYAMAQNFALGVDITSPQTSIDAVLKSVHDEPPDLRSHAAPDGTVTIVFSDIEGSTAMTERLGDQRWLELLREHNAIVRQQVKSHGGFEVKSEGDGFMLAFQSARRALQCAVAIQQAFAARNASLPAHPEALEGRAEPAPPAHGSRASPRAGREVSAATKGGAEPMRVRIGLHTGEAIKESEDFFGKHVNLAARVAGQAKGGEILVSSLLRELTEGAGEFIFGKARKVELKGLRGKHQVFQVVW